MPELEEKAVRNVIGDVTLTTTTEKVIISSGPVKVPRATCLVHIWARAVLQTGVATTAVTPRIRRGTTIAGLMVNGGFAEEIKAAAGSRDPFVAETIEQRQDMDTVEYSLTLTQANATGDGTVKEAAIVVEILGG